jgi:peptide-methionine (S)-S-oxide reductase
VITRRIAALALAAGLTLVGGSLLLAEERTRAAEAPPAGLAVATFAGGCFWCMEPPFDKLAGVVSTTSGYTGGRVPGATYREVTTSDTGHYEALRVVYDPKRVSYDTLLETFWRNVDPLDAGGQFCDRGKSYRTAIFAHDPEQRRLAEASKQRLVDSKRFDRPIVTPLVDAAPFYVAEEYHQDYYVKNPSKYKFYRWNCGRDARLKAVWGDEAPATQ